MSPHSPDNSAPPRDEPSSRPDDTSPSPDEPSSQQDDALSRPDEPSPRPDDLVPPDGFSPSPHFPLLAGIFEGALAVVALGLGWLVGERPLETLRLDLSGAAIGLAAVVPALVLFWVCLKLRWEPLRHIVRIMDEVVVPLFRPCRLGELAIIAALAGLGEELLFRGVIQAAAARLFDGAAGQTFGLLIAAMLFGLAHAITRTYAVLAALIGLYLGALWLASGNLLVPVVAHAGYDFLVLVYLVRFRQPVSEERSP